MKLHPLLQAKYYGPPEDRYRGELPVTGALEFWDRTESNIKIEFDRDARDKVLKHIAEQQRIIAIKAVHTQYDAIADLKERKEIYLKHVEDGNVAIEDCEFPHSEDSMRHEYEQKQVILTELLRRKIADAKKDSKRLVESVVASLRDSLEKMQKEEITAAARWGTPFEPSFGLKVLASQYQLLEELVAGIDNITEMMNPTRSTMVAYLPPCVGIK